MADEGDDARAPAIRIGDAERQAVDEHLQRAHGEGRLTLTEYEERTAKVWAARTQPDLDALTSDLPAGTSPLRAATTEPAGVGGSPWVRRGGRLLGALVLAAAVVLGGSHLLSRDDGAVVFSGRNVPVAPGDDRVELGVLFGGADVVVPDGARVNVVSRTMFGGVDCEAACAATGPGEITVDVSAVFGGVDILTQREAAAQAAEDAAEEAQDDAEDAEDDEDDEDDED